VAICTLHSALDRFRRGRRDSIGSSAVVTQMGNAGIPDSTGRRSNCGDEGWKKKKIRSHVMPVVPFPRAEFAADHDN